MRFRFRVAPRAGRQIRAAAKWWRERRTAAPTMLVDELESAYALIARNHLYYVVIEADRVIEVLSLWHTSRGKRPRL